MLIKCPECGSEVSDKSDKCIKCGYPIYLMMSQNKEKKKCSYCGFENSYSNSECERCGAVLEETDEKMKSNSNKVVTNTSNNKEIKNKKIVNGWVVLSLILFYPLGIWLIAYRKKELNSDWFTILSLVLFYPMGLFSMWYYKKFTKTGRIIITVICIVLIVLSLLSK